MLSAGVDMEKYAPLQRLASYLEIVESSVNIEAESRRWRVMHIDVFVGWPNWFACSEESRGASEKQNSPPNNI